MSVAVTLCFAGRTSMPPSRSRVAEVQLAALNQRLAALLSDYEAASRHLSYALDPVDQARLGRRIEALLGEIEELERRLESVHG